MSYFFFQQRCNDCEKIWSCSFGIVGTSQIGSGASKVCPECGSSNIETVQPSIAYLPISEEE